MSLTSPKSVVQGRRDLNINIPLPDLAKVGLRNGSMTELSIRAFNSALHAFQYNHTPSYVATQFHLAIEAFKAGEISQHELFRYTEVLMRYAHDFSTNRLKEGSASMVWDMSQGWYAGLERIATLGIAELRKPEPLPSYRLNRITTLETLIKELLDWSDYARNGVSDSLNGLQGPRSSYVLHRTVPNAEVRLGCRETGDIVFTYNCEGAWFKFTLVPQLGSGNTISPTMQICVQWNTAAHTPRADFALEDLAAKALPFGGLDLHGEKSPNPLT